MPRRNRNVRDDRAVPPPFHKPVDLNAQRGRRMQKGRKRFEQQRRRRAA